MAAAFPTRPAADGGAKHAVFRFPPWTNSLRPVLLCLVLCAPLYVLALSSYASKAWATARGRAPAQPVAFSHARHAGTLQVDCRYCHQAVERSEAATLPAARLCMDCHAQVHPRSGALLPLRQAWAERRDVPWVNVHDLAGQARFAHHVHLAAGVGCVSCHGRVDRMEVVRQVEPLTMRWCLDCHRRPEGCLRPRRLVTSMGWIPDEGPRVLGARLRREHAIRPRTDCSTCHR
jgi:hypothetical protein